MIADLPADMEISLQPQGWFEVAGPGRYDPMECGMYDVEARGAEVIRNLSGGKPWLRIEGTI